VLGAERFGSSVWKRLGILAVVIVFVLASWVWGLRRTLISDEIWFVHIATMPWPEAWHLARLDYSNTPVMPVLLRGWLAVAGLSDTTVKF
jgi:hypothetical protein